MFDASLTRRGRVVLGVCLVGAVMTVAVGGRSLNAVVLPGVVALAAGYLQVSRLEPPNARRSGITGGHVGEARAVRIDFHGDAPGSPVERRFVADVRDRLDYGLEAEYDARGGTRTAVGDEAATYRLRYVERGERRLGPVEVTATDVLGLFRRRLTVDVRDRVVAYPRLYAIPAWFRRGLYADEALGASRQREEFDRLREYARGDSLRDVHWPATAKHDELVVKEFAAETDRRRVSVAGGTRYSADDDAADVLASAVASLGCSLLDDGIPVDVRLPAGEVAAEPGPRGRRALLELAARTGPGPIEDPDDADVSVVAERNDARIDAEGRTVRLSELETVTTGRSGIPAADAGVDRDRPVATGVGAATDGGSVTVTDGGSEAVTDGGSGAVTEGDGGATDVTGRKEPETATGHGVNRR
ncbi:DUF58 domain-containing protein [Halorubrum sp. 48-1-W]|uniref:DUF58 domain-containing protein n=1 Tax=Halorubrum sp. 48-1-W TaxID=2249761 RepID=UPI000DCBFBD7|nr:DUF58 domain-containing protein [Halorubrum sp. 48-1-W]RAW44320.1 DUF58 domain-containing protein [Halorubrum sp. 48-1-W]